MNYTHSTSSCVKLYRNIVILHLQCFYLFLSNNYFRTFCFRIRTLGHWNWKELQYVLLFFEYCFQLECVSVLIMIKMNKQYQMTSSFLFKPGPTARIYRIVDVWNYCITAPASGASTSRNLGDKFTF